MSFLKCNFAEKKTKMGVFSVKFLEESESAGTATSLNTQNSKNHKNDFFSFKMLQIWLFDVYHSKNVVLNVFFFLNKESIAGVEKEIKYDGNRFLALFSLKILNLILKF